MFIIEQINALNRFALAHKRGWKHVLHTSWMNASYPFGTPPGDRVLLQQLRNNGGAELLATFRPRAEGYTRIGFLKVDRMERFNLKRGWFVKAWRIVNETGADLIQPWSNRKSEAQETADEVGICLVGVLQ
jgi:hypothetical protein